MLTPKWKSIIAFILIFTWLVLFENQPVEAASPQKVELEAKIVLDSIDLPYSKVVGLAYNGEYYVFVDTYGLLYQSENGFDWSRLENPNVWSLGYARQLIWDGERFVLLVQTRILSSKDGREWISHTPQHPDPKKEYVFEDVVYANGQYVILAQDRDRNAEYYTTGENTIFYGESLDDLKKAEKHDLEMSLAGERPLESILWTGNLYIAGGNGGAYSYDGAVWYGNGFGRKGNMIWDGTGIWEASGSDISIGDEVGVIERNPLFRRVYKSPEDAEHRVQLKSIGYNGHSYIAAGKGETTTVIYSTDGVEWQRVLLGTEASDILEIYPTPYGYLLAGDRIWYVSETNVDSPSAWAASELEQAIEDQLVPEVLRGFYQSPVMRKDFSVLAVRVYEALTNRSAEAPKTNPFRDTVHSDVLKANKLGIINGTSADRFSPDNHITRQDMATIMYRTLQAAGLHMSPGDSEWRNDYEDIDEVASYAEEALRFMNQEGIIGGRSASRLDPRGTASREESIIMIARMYERFKDQLETYPEKGRQENVE